MEHKRYPFHDQRIIGFLYNERNASLEIYLNNGQKIGFDHVIFFEFTDISMQNIIFDLYLLTAQDLNDDLCHTFPTLHFYRHNDELAYFHIAATCGCEAIIICPQARDFTLPSPD